MATTEYAPNVLIDHDQAQAVVDAFEQWMLDQTDKMNILITSETIEHASQNLYYIMRSDSYKGPNWDINAA